MATETVRSYIERNISGSWSDISSYVVGDLDYEYLIPRNDADELLASVGEMNLVMNNGDGQFSPNPNFRRGTPIRLRTVYDGISVTRFKGTILDIDPDTLEWGDQYVRVLVVDWMNFAVNFPMTTPELQTSQTIDSAMAYLLTLVGNQPDSVTYKGGRETFDFVFDNLKKQTTGYTEFNRLAHSEYAPIYLKGGNNLVIESRNTRNGTRELTTIPASPGSSVLLTSQDAYPLLTADGVPLIANLYFTPNLVSGTFQPMDIEIENGGALANRVTVTGYPSRVDANPVKLYQNYFSEILRPQTQRTFRGTYANPDGGALINAQNVIPVTTGSATSIYQFFDKLGTTELTGNIVKMSEIYGAKEFEVTFFNSGSFAYMNTLKVYGYGLYPYNPSDKVFMVTGSTNTFGISELKFDQNYQDDTNESERIAEMIADDEKTPRNRLISITFDASSSPQLMQASQYMDTGDLTYVKNIKPSIDTYAYIDGKKVTISPAGIVTEKWHLREMDSLKKGLSPVALACSTKNGSKNALDFGISAAHGSGGEHTWSCWFFMIGGVQTAALISKTNEEQTGTASNDLFINAVGTASYRPASVIVRRAFTGQNGGAVWQSPSGTLTGLQDSWHHLAMVYDDSSILNDPAVYLDGVALTMTETSPPTGTAVPYDNAPLILANVNIPSVPYNYNLKGYEYDARLYNRLLTQQEVLLLASDRYGWQLVPSGMVFQAPCVKTEDLISTGTILYSTDRLIDNVYGLRGTPYWNTISGSGYELKYYRPVSVTATGVFPNA